MPKIDEMYANLHGEKIFTTLDLQSGYYHIALDKDSNQRWSFKISSTTVDKIKMFKFKKGNGLRAKGGPGKTCGKCGESHPPRELISTKIVGMVLML